MACVYRAFDRAARRDVALKRLTFCSGSGTKQDSALELFEREFHTLAQLSHPRIIEVYDYSVDASGPYYTMELLDGKDLRERSPLPWREASALLYDVCSSLALVHSRRLVHRDVSPRNIRCTPDGRGKLIDFGTMAPMGPGAVIVGTPSFMAPEVLHLSALDGRTDLFSLGATLYFAVTGRIPYAAASIAELVEAWTVKPIPPSQIVPDVPPGLDDLILSLLNLEPAMRPRGAFEVMQRLATLASLERTESESVSRAYLSTPVLVGRTAPLASVRADMTAAFEGAGRSVLVQGLAGIGRSRFLDAAVLEAKTLGATVLRANATSTRDEAYGAIRVLVEQLLRAHPASAERATSETSALFVKNADGSGALSFQVSVLASGDASAVAAVSVLQRWMRRMAAELPLAILVDDAHQLDESCMGFLAALANDLNGTKTAMIATAELGVQPLDRVALDLFAERSHRLVLDRLSGEQTEELFASLFGDVPNVGLVSARIHDISKGNPRASMDLAGHLVARGIVRYESGNWTLPDELTAADLPTSAKDAIARRVAALSPLARLLAEAQALASHDGFSRPEYSIVAGGKNAAALDSAISELVSEQVVLGDGHRHRLAHGVWSSALLDGLSDDVRRARHAALVDVYRKEPGLAVVRHMLDAGQESDGVDRLLAFLGTIRISAEIYRGGRLSAEAAAATIACGLEVARRLGRLPRSVSDIRRWLVAISIPASDSHYFAAAPEWLARLEHDAGIDLFHSARDVADEVERVKRCIQGANERYVATPEAERVYAPDEARRLLMHYIAISIAIGSRAQDNALLETLPPLAAVFAPVSPVAAALLENATATCESMSRSQPERARARWRDLLERLKSFSLQDLPFLPALRNAVTYGIGSMETGLGIATAATWAEVLENDPLQQVNALYLRKTLALQQGDWEGAAEFRKRAEVLLLGAGARQMFASSLVPELTAHCLADDLTGVKQLADRIRRLATGSERWAACAILADAHFKRICGDAAAAREAFDACIALSAPDAVEQSRSPGVWLSAVAGQIETLASLGAMKAARALGSSVLATCAERSIVCAAFDVARALALVEAKLGDHESARARLDCIIQTQTELGVTGLLLGLSYEAQARCAVWRGDRESVEKYAALTAEEYRHGRNSPLGVRYQRLVDEAKRAGGLLSHGNEAVLRSANEQPEALVESVVRRVLGNANTAAERAQRVLTVLCEGSSASSGHLFVFRTGDTVLAASYGEASPPPGLVEFVRQLAERDVDDANQETVMLDDIGQGTTASPSIFVDERGNAYRSVVMTSVDAGRIAYSGVVVVRGNTAMLETRMLDVIGRKLANFGDTQLVFPTTSN
jgi:hypothetical protein